MVEMMQLLNHTTIYGKFYCPTKEAIMVKYKRLEKKCKNYSPRHMLVI